MTRYQVTSEVRPGEQVTNEIEADSEEEAKAKAREEYGGYPVGQIVNLDEDHDDGSAQPGTTDASSAHSGQAHLQEAKDVPADATEVPIAEADDETPKPEFGPTPEADRKPLG